MRDAWKEKAARRSLFGVLVVLLLFGAAYSTRVFAQDNAVKDRIYVVIHVDTLPGNGPGAQLLKQYVADSKKDKGAIRIELYDQINRANHFSIVEVWESQAAYDAHLAAAHTRQFREQIQPMLGSPFDERLHQIVE